MLSQNPEQSGDKIVSIPMATMLDMVRSLQGLQEKEEENKHLKQIVRMLQSKLLELEEVVAVSETECKAAAQVQHRSSAPAIFVYPEVSEKSGVLKSRGNKIEPTAKTAVQQKNTNGQAGELPLRYGVSDQVGTKPNSVNQSAKGVLESYASIGGVSELYFNNVVNELVKTKQCLYQLEKQSKENLAQKESTEEEEALRQELKELKLQYEQVQRENVLLKMPGAETEEEKKSHYDSFLMVNSNPETDEKITQTEDVTIVSPADIQKFQSQLARLNKDRKDLLKQLEQKNIQLNQMKESVKVFGTCIHEEKERNKQLEDNLHSKLVENNKLSEMMAHMRQQWLLKTGFTHEMLSREKHALEKRLSFSAYQQTVCDRHTSSESAGSDYVLPVSRIQSDTEQHQEFPCPTCLQDFNTETSYMAHIAKCVVD